MSDAKSAWDEVGSKFTGLGSKLRYHFEQVRSETETETGAEPGGAGGAEGAAAGQPGAPGQPGAAERGGPSATGPEVKEALRKLGDALDDAFAAFGNAARDQAVKEDLRQVGQSLATALSATFDDVSDELRKAFRRGKP
jgi:Flp pilus assembly pilin Flp